MSTVKLKVYQYCGNGMKEVEVPATIRGELAVHRPVYWYLGEEPQPSDKGWTVTHVPTGLSLWRAMPTRLQAGTTRKALADWAERFQAAIPEFFERVRSGPIGVEPSKEDSELGRRAMSVGASL